jgi:hypothetical protein
MHTAKDYQRATAELDRTRTPIVLFDLSFRNLVPHVWPSTPAAALATDPMGDFIFEHYKVCTVLLARTSPFISMVRKDLPCPS